MALKENENSADKVIRRLDEQHSKYKLMEYNIGARRRKLKFQIPDLAKSIEMIDVLRKQTDDEETQFLLSEQVFLKTMVPPTKLVCLWLGANVMLEYPLDEAEVLLKQNMESAELNLKCLEHDQDFLRYGFLDHLCKSSLKKHKLSSRNETHYFYSFYGQQRSTYHTWSKHGPCI